jgi:Phage tail sheath protein subtilisin-like domain/Phage tail sheath C-terminal domain
MPFQVSPGVNVSEIDLTTVVPAVSTTEGAIAGVFHWGPVDQRILVDSETTLVNRFGKPSTHNAETFFTAANFLSYGNQLYVTRTANVTVSTSTSYTYANGSSATLAANVISAYTAIGNTSAVTTRTLYNIKNRDDFDAKQPSFDDAGENGVIFAAKYPGSYGNSLRVSQCDTSNQFSQRLQVTPNTFISNTASSIRFVVGNTAAVVAVSNSSTGSLSDAANVVNTVFGSLNVGDVIVAGNTTIGFQRLKVASFSALDASDNSANLTSTSWSALDPQTNSTHYFATINFETKYNLAKSANNVLIDREWEYAYLFDTAPGTSYWQSTKGGNTSVTDELHIVVVDRLGSFTGSPGTIVETYKEVSRATDAKLEDGTSNYYMNVINDTSNYIWATNARSGAAAAPSATVATSSATTPLSFNLSGGSDGFDEDTIEVGDVLRGYDLYASPQSVDVSLILQGKARGPNDNYTQLANYLTQNIAEVRKDCVVFATPPVGYVVRNPGGEAISTLTYRNSLVSSSYLVVDSAYKYQYDKYNDMYRYVPLNGDTAGLCVRTDSERDPWYSPAGFNRGQVKNIIKLSYNPSQTERDLLYKAGVNPVVTFPGQGTVLFGDKTALARPSAFDRINVRRLFITLEKSISTASKYMLFEFNDTFTRAQFRNMVEPFLRDIQGRRGIYDFKVVCDESNNPASVIDRGEFVGDIYIKPARSINFIQLNFVAVRTGVEFNEIVGNV